MRRLPPRLAVTDRPTAGLDVRSSWPALRDTPWVEWWCRRSRKGSLGHRLASLHLLGTAPVADMTPRPLLEAPVPLSGFKTALWLRGGVMKNRMPARLGHPVAVSDSVIVLDWDQDHGDLPEEFELGCRCWAGDLIMDGAGPGNPNTVVTSMNAARADLANGGRLPVRRFMR